MTGILPASFQLKSKVIVVTGCSRGIGLEFAKQLLEKENTVVAAVRDPQGKSLQALKASYPQTLKTSSVDVSSYDSIKSWSQSLADLDTTVDVVINNAGVLVRGGIDIVTPEDMLESYKVNAMGPLFVAKALLEKSLLQPGSLVATVTSLVASIEENGSGGNYAYRMSKIAANMAAKNLSIDLAPSGITSTILHPGYVRTDMTQGSGFIDCPESVKGMIDVLESGKPLNGEWYHTSGRHLPW